MRALALVAVCLTLAAASARAQVPDVGAAKARFAAGTAFFQQKRYRDAVAEFVAAYRLSHAVDFFYNIGVCYEALDDPGRATIYFERYLAERPSASERSEIERSLYHSSSRVGRLLIHAPANAAITVDGLAIEVAPPAPLPVTAGRHRVVALRDGAPIATVEVEVAAALSQEVALDAVVAAREAPRRRRWLWPVVGAAAVVVAAAVIITLLFTVHGTDFHAQGAALCAGHPGCAIVDFGSPP